MFIGILQIVLILIFLLIFYQDIKHREVTWFLFLFIFFISFLIAYTRLPIRVIIIYNLINLLLVSTILLSTTLYFSIRKKRLLNIVNKQIGLGDIVFFYSVIPLFSPLNFTLFFIISLLFSLVLHISFKKTYNTNHTSLIPLAGYMSIFSILAFISSFLGVNLYDDMKLIQNFYY